MPGKSFRELSKQEIAARIIQRAWKNFLAELLDAAAGIQVRFRLGGFWIPTENEVLESTKESEFHFSKLKRKQDMEKKRKIKKIEWMRQMYYLGNLEAKATHHETLGLIHRATKGLIRCIEDGGVDSVMEWEVDEVLNWTNTLNFDEYIANWKETATSNSSANLKDVRLEQIQKSLYVNYGDGSEPPTQGPYEDDYYENTYIRRQFTPLTPTSPY
ncbi:protein MFI isoform X5 [Mesocricetus auratus]|uniref:Protein MFI isoform X5 n=1 Tax=Mesocricetus auratus TaxID=10036 RepID=A0ABM2WBU8_MESAU|nr:protein MFI isoform X5 [Mesocricetus auratus]